MAEKKKEVRIRETKEVVFGILKAAAPALFGTKVWADVAQFNAQTSGGDGSYLEIVFNEEVGE